MDNIIAFPLPEPAATPANIDVMDAVFVQRLAAANALTRKLRDWHIGVDAILIPSYHEDTLPVMWVRPDPSRSMRPLFAATAGRRCWLPAGCGQPERMTATLDGCMIMWVLPPSHAPARGIEACHA
jgi:hypothetical protein